MYHKTYRLSITMTKGRIAYPGEPEVVLEVEDGGHDQVLDKALDYLLSVGRRPLTPQPAPRLDFIPSSTIRTERYLITTVPADVQAPEPVEPSTAS